MIRCTSELAFMGGPPTGQTTDRDVVLLRSAREAASKSYSPYSQFRVGAAVLAGGQIFQGANVENASFGLTVCAERTAIFKAVLSGHLRLEAIAVACIDAPLDGPPEGRMPCGACRQVMAEFAAPETTVIIEGVGILRLADLLPRPFLLVPKVPVDSPPAGP